MASFASQSPLPEAAAQVHGQQPSGGGVDGKNLSNSPLSVSDINKSQTKAQARVAWQLPEDEQATPTTAQQELEKQLLARSIVAWIEQMMKHGTDQNSNQKLHARHLILLLRVSAS